MRFYGILEDGRTFGDFQRPGMQPFLRAAVPGYRGIHRQKIQLKCRRIMIERFLKIKKFVITTDLWKNTTNSHFIGITAYYFDKNLKYKWQVIGLREFEGRYFSTSIEHYIGYAHIKKIPNCTI